MTIGDTYPLVQNSVYGLAFHQVVSLVDIDNNAITICGDNVKEQAYHQPCDIKADWVKTSIT